MAAGIGDTGFVALRRVLPGGRLLSTDVAPEMVEAARRRAVEVDVPADSVEFAVEDATALSLADDSVDGIVCRFGFMLVPDMPRAFAEAARVLREGGRVAFAVWATPPENPWISTTGRVALDLGLMEPPDPTAPGPFRLANTDELRAMVTGAGLHVESVEDVPIAWRATSLDEWWESTRDMSRLFSILVGSLTSDQVEALRVGAFDRLEPYVGADGSLEVPGVARAVLARPSG